MQSGSPATCPYGLSYAPKLHCAARDSARRRRSDKPLSTRPQLDALASGACIQNKFTAQESDALLSQTSAKLPTGAAVAISVAAEGPSDVIEGPRSELRKAPPK